MPLCHSKVEQVTTEDLVELSEIEKQNLGQVGISALYVCWDCNSSSTFSVVLAKINPVFSSHLSNGCFAVQIFESWICFYLLTSWPFYLKIYAD